MQQGDEQLNEQANKPLNEKEVLLDSNEPGEKIIKGARNEDQLVRLNQAAAETSGEKADPKNQIGASPDTYLPPDERE